MKARKSRLALLLVLILGSCSAPAPRERGGPDGKPVASCESGSIQTLHSINSAWKKSFHESLPKQIFDVHTLGHHYFAVPIRDGVAVFGAAGDSGGLIVGLNDSARDNNTFGLSARPGSLIWTQAGGSETTGILAAVKCADA